MAHDFFKDTAFGYARQKKEALWSVTPPDSPLCSETGGQKEKIFNTLELAWPDPCISIQSIFFNVKIQSIRGSFLVFSASSLVFPLLNASHCQKLEFLLLGGAVTGAILS